MTTRQQILKAIYPFLMQLAALKAKVLHSSVAEPVTSFYNLQAYTNNNELYRFEQLKGKKVLLVNTASDCGYTLQYKDLQQLQDRYKNSLVILGFPANDFKAQEKGNDDAIANFCALNFGVSFRLMKKSGVVKGPLQNEVFEWLSDPHKNGWNQQAPRWNFCKYLVNEQGILTHYFDTGIAPLSSTIIKLIDT
jgi:glutathione peroxidase